MMLVLLVEDNASEEMLAMLAIRKADVSADVVVARDGQEALDYLFGGGENADRPTSRLPTVALLDLNLPKIGGLDVLRRIRADERTRRLPVVVLTTSKEDEDLARAYDLGANAFVCKPVAFEEFARAVNTLLAFWLVLNEVAPPAKALEEAGSSNRLRAQWTSNGR
jgi:two-component system, response regulator